jgi:hypothetical protein
MSFSFPDIWTSPHTQEFKDHTPLEKNQAGRRWLTAVILATQEAEIRRIVVRSQPGQIVPRDFISKKPLTKIGLAKWFKVKAPSSSPSTSNSINKYKKPGREWAVLVIWCFMTEESKI